MAMQREPQRDVLPGQDSLRLTVIVRIPTPLRKLTNEQDIVVGRRRDARGLHRRPRGAVPRPEGPPARRDRRVAPLREHLHQRRGRPVRTRRPDAAQGRRRDQHRPGRRGGREEPRDEPRLKYYRASPGAYQALKAAPGLRRAAPASSRSLLELVKLRASQLNGCAFCYDMHWKDARAARRDRGAPLHAQRLARILALQRTRARRPRLDGRA